MALKMLNKITQNLNSTGKMPVLFLGHGSPMNAIEENEFVLGFRSISQYLPTPAAILCISAHWETRGTYVTAMENPPTIHDFGGFPRELFDVQYPAPGSPQLVNEVISLQKTATVKPDHKWGLDHGAWSVIKHLYPEANIPVVQMSLDYYQSAQYHYDLMKQLAPLRQKGILIIGSGNMVHNLRLIDWNKLSENDYAYDWAVEASEKMKKYIISGDHKQLINYRCHGRAFDLAIPTPEHYLPLICTLALKEEDENAELFNDKAVAGSITMTSLKIG
jgi:4,5-DOPA dioxygenase extradiol